MNIEQKTVNNLRVLSSAVISNANSGHTGIALSACPLIYELYSKHIKVTPKTTKNIFRDRFVLSAGHGSALLYSVLHAFNFNISKNQLKNFRKNGSMTAGHPELNNDCGIECTTGPLGQGVSMAVGMAIAEKMLESRFNKPDLKIFDYKVYSLVGDGCMMEGVAQESFALAGNLKLNNLIILYDSNKNSLDSSTDLTSNYDIEMVMKGYGFNVLHVEDGNDLILIGNALKLAQNSDKPSIIICNTILGYGTEKENSNTAHGMVLKPDELEKLKFNLGIKVADNFSLENDVIKNINAKCDRFLEIEREFDFKLKTYKLQYKKEYLELTKFINQDYSDIDEILKAIPIKENTSTREMSGIILNALAEKYHYVVGGTADLSSSTKASIKQGGIIKSNDFSGKNILYGVREFAMSCVSNGITLSGFKSFASTFLVFSDYMKSAIRLSAIMNIPSIYILTHDSIAVGEDGMTHQPVEQIVGLRSTPNLNVFRPCNFTECLAAYKHAITNSKPTALILSRQNIECCQSNFEDAQKGAYIISKESKGELHGIIISTGSEVPLAINVQKLLYNTGINVRVISMPSMNIFDEQPNTYIQKILPISQQNVFSIEAGSTICWGKYVGKFGKSYGVDSFGFSAKPEEIYEHFGLVSDSLANDIRKIIKTNRSKN